MSGYGSIFSDRIVLVTGASRGIGRAVAVALGKAGAHVVAVARTVGGLEELDDDIKKEGGKATLVPLDLKDFAGIDRMAAAIHERWGRLDALFGNAGILGALTPIAHLVPKTWDDIVAINVTANLRLIRGFDPLLRRSDAGRVLMMSSAVARLNRPYWGPYAMSKAAVEMLTFTYAAECNGTNVKANACNPGATRTRMRAEAMPGEDPMTLPAPEELAPFILEMLSPACTKNGELVTFRR
ncbi:MAG TPA: SDR family NAD(P)-dependent oxidoreductase [Micropepsaceae bacterium]|jgi:NAD(P)-dependent dehydrogenase (short-subunit alcohol dehydrogenase family)|nr:SDR family NAD(P)-dependent oxidoreductase [Micropepsaceae bacterium]